VRKLLEDKDARVRLRSAQGMLTMREKAAVPVLVGLLDEPDVEIAWQAEELLHWIAEETAPEVAVAAASAAERRRCQQAWQRWWEERKGELDWEAAERDCRRPGLVLSWHSVLNKEGCIKGDLRFRLCGCDGAERFGFERKLQGCDWVSNPVMWTGKGLLLPVRDPAARPEDESDVTHSREGYALPRERPIRLREVDLGGKTVWESQTFEAFSMPNWRRLGDGRILVSDGISAIELESGGQVRHKRKLASFDETKWMKAGGRPGKPKPKDKSEIGLPRLGPGDGWFGKEGRLLTDRQGKENDYTVEYDAGGGEWVAAKAQGYGKPDDLPILMERAMDGRSGVLRLRNGNLVLGHGRIREKDWGPMEVDAMGRNVWEGPTAVAYDASVEMVCPLIRFGFPRGARTEPTLDTVAGRLRRLKSRIPVVRERAAEWLLGAPPSKEVGTAFLGLLKDKDPTMRYQALKGVHRARAQLQTALPMVAQLVEDKDKRVSGCATWVLGDWDPDAISVLLEIAENKDKSDAVRFRAAKALVRHLKDPHPGVLPAVRRAMREGPPELRRGLIQSMHPELVKGVDGLLPALLSALHDSDEGISLGAGIVLGNLGSEADKAVPTLLRALADRRFRLAATVALQGIHPKDKAVIEKLIGQLPDREDVRGLLGVMDALGSYGSSAAPAVPVLIEALKYPPGKEEDHYGRSIRNAAIGALRQIGKEARAAVPVLLAIVKDAGEHPSMRKFVAEALCDIDPEAGKAAEAIVRPLRLPVRSR
jgi:HEAT repeat protein